MMNVIKQFPIKAGFVLLLLFLLISVWLISQYTAKERSRDLMSWQSRIGILADMKKASVESLLKEKKQTLAELGSNPTLQLYLSQYQSANGKDDEILRAQLSHVRNLLRATASRLGFASINTNAFNTEHMPSSYQGLAVLNAKGDAILSTKGFVKNFSRYKPAITGALSQGVEQVIDLYPVDGMPVFGFVTPVLPLQGLQAQRPVGAVLVLLSPTNELFKRLENLHLDTQSDESLLIRKNENSLVYISPLQKEFKVFHQMAASNQNLASSFAFERPGDFALKQDYRGVDVLVTGRIIENTSWLLVQKIDADEALEESNRHQRFLVTAFGLVTLLVMAMFIAIWRHSTSVRLQKITAALETRTALLNAVSDNINEHIFLVDENREFVFANQSLANCVHIKPEDFVGKSIASVLGPDVSDHLTELDCDLDRGTLPCMINLPLGNEQSNVYHVSTVTLKQGDYKDAKLYVLHDITSLRNAQEKRDRLARGIISTLVKAVDLHDPFCVDHSERTREVAIGIAKELKLDAKRCEALELAALLANIGKLFVPKDILIKMEPLSEAENEMLKKHIDYAIDILKQLAFEGPVVEIIAQKNEYLDGSGYPKGLQGDDILLESRILAVANAFVAMASSRAYREGRPIEEVIDILLEQSSGQYDRHVVAALFHIAENKTDWHKWQVVSTDH